MSKLKILTIILISILHITFSYANQDIKTNDIIRISQWLNGRGKIKIDEIENILPNLPFKNELQEKAEILIEEYPYKKIINWFIKFPPKTAYGHKVYGMAIANTPYLNFAKNIIQDSWIYGKFTFKESEYFLNKYKNILTKEDHYKKIDNILWNEDYIDNKELIKKLLPLMDEAQVEIINFRVLCQTKDPLRHSQFLSLPSFHQNNPDIIYSYIISLRGKTTTKITEILSKIEPLAGKENEFAKVKIEYTKQLIKKAQYKDAYKVIQSIKGGNPNLRYICESKWLAGFLLLEYLKNPKSAKAYFLEYADLATLSYSKSRGYYWIARSYKKMKDINNYYLWIEKAAKFGQTFYGQMSTMEIGKELELAIPTDKEIYQDEFSKIAIELFQLKQYKLGVDYAILSIKAAEQPEKIAYLMDIYSEYADLHSMASLGRFIANSMGVVILKYAYPTPYDLKNITKTPELIYALIRQESCFNKYAQDFKSQSDLGLMQISPPIARALIQKGDKNSINQMLLQDPYYNIKIGSTLVNQLLRRYNSAMLTMVSYNLGNKILANWIKKFGDPRKFTTPIELIKWVENIPNPIVKIHFQRVFENWIIYKMLLLKNTMVSF